jgi:beta-galactosidase
LKTNLTIASVTIVLISVSSALAAEDISTAGWRLWPDRQAAWQNDTLYLPSEVQLDKMPVNPPTGGWNALSDTQGIPVTLPSTVEEHFWGAFGVRPYALNEAQKGPKTAFPNGNYLGVSWWWRTIQPATFQRGQRVIVSFRGARLRAEVYCNGKLCGYTIMTELPFQADITDALIPGQPATLAVRITNAGGMLDWIDFACDRFKWGKYTFPPSHGFGGLDENIQLEVRDDAAVTDLAAINTPDLHTVHLTADIRSHAQPYNGPVHFAIERQGKTVWNGEAQVAMAAGETKTIALDAVVPSAQAWDLSHPNLYNAIAKLDSDNSDRSVAFGFRYFTAEGIGSSEDAILTLNGQRKVLISAISWGYWGRNGLWPDAEMAMREVSNAKALGLNCLQFHRNIGKPAVLDLQDRMGLLRSEEPGAGKFAIGARYSRGPFTADGEYTGADDGIGMLGTPKGYVRPEKVDTSGEGPDGDAQVFWEKYEEEKILEMVRRDRSHPSLVDYTMQNENSDMDIRNPRIYRLYREIHKLDPSRIIIFYSGGMPRDAQVLMLPYSDTIYTCTNELPFAGWRDCHTCGGPCNYLDNLYTDPTHFATQQPPEFHKVICMWGEMFGAAAPDDYDTLVHSFDAAHPTGYERDDATKVLDGYHQFIDRYGFRQAFPTDSSLFQSIGYRSYYFWQRIIEQARVENANDSLVISGWESTTIDNHSGLVDNHRFLKGDPTVLAEACRPELLFIQPRHMIVAKGDQDIADIFLINETNRTGAQSLRISAAGSDGKEVFSSQMEVTAIGGHTFGQLLAEGITFPASTAGMMTIKASLTPQTSSAASMLTRLDQIEVVDFPQPESKKAIGLSEPNDEVRTSLHKVFGLDPVNLSDLGANERVDAIVLATKSMNRELFKPGAVDPKAKDKTPPPPEVSKASFDDALRRVKEDGTRLVLWPDTNAGAEAFAKALADRSIVTYGGDVGNLGAPWFGDWFFVRKHWLVDGLPGDCAMDWRYGISAFAGPAWLHTAPKGNNCDGLLIDAPGIEVVVGYGADHNSQVGVSGCVIPYGKGQIVLYCLPQLVQSLKTGSFAISPVIAQKLLGNAVLGHS